MAVKITSLIANLPSVKSLRDRQAFKAVSSIPLRDWYQLKEASSWSEARWNDFGRKYRKRTDADEQRAWFEFESDEDAVEFLLRFG